MTNEQLRQEVRDLVVLMSGLAVGKVVFGNEGGTRAAKQYATILRIATVREGTDDVMQTTAVGGDSAKLISGIRLSTFSVQFFGDGADDLADTMFQATTEYGALSSVSGIAVVDVVQTTNLTEAVDAEREERAGVDLRVRWNYTKTLVGSDAGGTIEHAVVSGQVDSTDVDIAVDWP